MSKIKDLTPRHSGQSRSFPGLLCNRGSQTIQTTWAKRRALPGRHGDREREVAELNSKYLSETNETKEESLEVKVWPRVLDVRCPWKPSFNYQQKI
jgi:hypothetical protein